jgi:hypothetical protein
MRTIDKAAHLVALLTPHARRGPEALTAELDKLTGPQARAGAAYMAKLDHERQQGVRFDVDFDALDRLREAVEQGPEALRDVVMALDDDTARRALGELLMLHNELDTHQEQTRQQARLN